MDLINCLCLYCWSFHSGSSCQLSEGKPMAAMSIIGYLSSNDIKSSLKALLLQMISTKCFNMQRVKNIRPCLTLLLTQGVNGLVMVRVRRESERFHIWRRKLLISHGRWFKGFERRYKAFEYPFKALGCTYKALCRYNDSLLRTLIKLTSDSFSTAVLRVPY